MGASKLSSAQKPTSFHSPELGTCDELLIFHLFSPNVFGHCNCVAKIGTFFVEENFTSDAVVSHNNYCRFS